jgi:fucose 4-O-acetylase-like acetyltransferase
MQNRNQFHDSWKGVAIISVIGIHACNLAVSYPPEDHNHLVGLFYRTIFNFAVALFFVFAGYFTPSASEIKNRGILEYYRQRLSLIWISYLLWTGLYLFLRNRSAFTNTSELLEAIILGRGIGIGYFVIILSTLVIVHPFIGRLPRNYSLAISAFVSFLSVLVLYWARIEFPDHRYVRFPSITSIIFTTWMFFYYLGVYLAATRKSLLREGPLLGAIGLSLSLSFAESIWISHQLGATQLAASQIKITTYISSALISTYAIFYGARAFGEYKLLAWAGRRSYVLYLSHMLFLSEVSKLLSNFDWIIRNQILYIPLATSVTFACASICVVISEKSLPSVFVLYILGIKKEANK